MMMRRVRVRILIGRGSGYRCESGSRLEYVCEIIGWVEGREEDSYLM